MTGVWTQYNRDLTERGGAGKSLQRSCGEAFQAQGTAEEKAQWLETASCI